MTTNAWGNLPSNPNRLQVQTLCAAIIGNTTSAFGAPGSAQANGFTGPFGFFPLEIESREGNSAVKNETADTYTLGVVFQKQRWSMSVDVYDIEIEHAIAPLSSFTAYSKCFNADGQSNPTYSINDPGGFCKLIVRNPIGGDRFQVKAPYFNLGGIKTTGVDGQFNWGMQRFSVNFAINYIDKYETQATPESPFLDAAGTLDQGGQYTWRTNTNLRYNVGDKVTLGVNWRHLPEVKAAATVQTPNSTVDPTAAYDVFDFFGSFNINQRSSLRFGVDNLLDTEAKIVGADPPNTNATGFTYPGYYDVLGQRWYVGYKMSF